jgi:hypothetical protein
MGQGCDLTDYDNQRPHSSLADVPPDKFRAARRFHHDSSEFDIPRA